MQTTEQLFKKDIEKHIDPQLRKLNYDKVEEWKGFVKYTSSNNYLRFNFDWNRSHEFDCKLGFNDNSENEFSIHEVLAKLGKCYSSSELKFGTEIADRISNWLKELSLDLQAVNLSDLTSQSQIIKELTKELQLQTDSYNSDLQFEQLKRIVDKAWEENNYELFIDKIQHKLDDFPKSYSTKLSIAKKKLI